MYRWRVGSIVFFPFSSSSFFSMLGFCCYFELTTESRILFHFSWPYSLWQVLFLSVSRLFMLFIYSLSFFSSVYRPRFLNPFDLLSISFCLPWCTFMHVSTDFRSFGMICYSFILVFADSKQHHVHWQKSHLKCHQTNATLEHEIICTATGSRRRRRRRWRRWMKKKHKSNNEIYHQQKRKELNENSK